MCTAEHTEKTCRGAREHPQPLCPSAPLLLFCGLCIFCGERYERNAAQALAGESPQSDIFMGPPSFFSFEEISLGLFVS